MNAPPEETDRLDPRKRRTRVALQHALELLLGTKGFESISVQDIAERADLNRATFYAHYPDKFALLECMVGSRFTALLAKRNITAEVDCASALEGLALAVCEYLTLMTGDGERQHQLEPHIEAAVIGAVRRMMLTGLEEHVPRRKVLCAVLSHARDDGDGRKLGDVWRGKRMATHPPPPPPGRFLGRHPGACCSDS